MSKRSGRTLNYQDRTKLYIKVSMHPRFEKLSERQQSVMEMLATGATLIEIADEWHVTDSMTGLIRDQSFRILGYTKIENGKCRVMKVWEVWEEINGQLQ